jgi:hypothetical protein
MVELAMRVSLLLLLTVLTASAKSINPAVKRIVDAVSEERIAAIEKKLESFETRNIYSDPDHPTRGIGAARRWIFEQSQGYSPRIQVSFVAPGVTDDASGKAAVLELARILSQYEFEKTIVFVAFAEEEEGLIGSTLFAAKARRENRIIDAVLNNDIIGSDLAGNGLPENRRIRVFSEHPDDSPSRQLARYIRDIGERYLSAMKVDLIFRHDRFQRGGDHTAFNYEGYAAVRFTTPAENYANQHTATVIFANTSPGYAARAIRINAAALASLALAPKAPVVTREVKSGEYKGLFVGNVNEYSFEDVSIDDLNFGVKAIDRDGNESLVSAYADTPRPKRVIEVY